MLASAGSFYADQLDEMAITQMLIDAQQSYVNAFDVLAVVVNQRGISAGDLMRAYQVANDWVLWLENPHAENCPIKNKDLDYSSHAGTMRMYVHSLECILSGRINDVKSVFDKLSPGEIALAKRKDSEGIPEYFKPYLKTLRTTAEFFRMRGHSEFMQKIS